jgi:hypothetical protein
VSAVLRALLVAGAVTIAALVIGAALFTTQLPSAEVWTGLTPGDCLEYCEGSHRCGALAERDAIQQPLNAWSNLAYLVVGLLALAPRRTPGSVALFASCAALALGSFLFHASVTREMQWLDVVATEWVLLALLARGLHDAFAWPWPHALAVWAGAGTLYAIFKWQLSTHLVYGASLLAVAVCLVRLVRSGRVRGRLGLGALALGVAAYAVRELDVQKVGCDPAGIVYQGHALWHLLTAASILAAWRAMDDARAQEAR